MRKKLGDSHNFGKFVFRENDKTIFKPRTLVWERLLLDFKSPLRSEAFGGSDSIPQALVGFPRLNYGEHCKKALFLGQGSVELLRLKKLTFSKFDYHLNFSIGCLIGTSFWLGITDLHSQNIMTGIDALDRVVLGPIDVECILENITLPSQTHLIPSRFMSAKQCGLNHFFESTNLVKVNIATLIEGYLTSYLAFEKQKCILLKLLSVSPFRNAPIRVIFRHTKDYIDFLESRHKMPKKPFCKSELLQLKRGDVPYYFRRLNSAQARYMKTESSSASFEVKLPKKRFRVLDSKTLGPLNSRKSIELGAVQVASSFYREIRRRGLNPKTKVEYESNQTLVLCSDNNILIRSSFLSKDLKCDFSN